MKRLKADVSSISALPVMITCMIIIIIISIDIVRKSNIQSVDNLVLKILLEN